MRPPYTWMNYFLCVVFALLTAPTSQSEETIEELRQQFQQAQINMVAVETPQLGQPGFLDDLSTWTKADAIHEQAAKKLLVALIDHWQHLPAEADGLQQLSAEIKSVSADLGGDPDTGQYGKMKSFMARTTWTALVAPGLTAKQADFLAELYRPQKSIRINDSLALVGIPTEPYGWDVQSAYALALIRSGKSQQAQYEITILQKKVSRGYGRNPAGSLDYGPEAGTSRYRDYVDYLQLCQALQALLAQNAGDQLAAKGCLEKLRQLRPQMCTEVNTLVTNLLMTNE